MNFISPMSRSDRLAIFVFARPADGRPAFDEEDRGVEFCSGEGRDRIQVNFDLRKMKTAGQLDF